MINFFPELKRPKSDGMRSALGLEDHRNPFEIHLGLFGEDDSGGGSDNVDRSNPREMAAREKAAARAGTVTSTNADGTRSAVTSGGGTGVVTSGTQGQQVAAREAFNAATGNTRSNYAQSQYDEVKGREDAALQRAAAAGKLAGSDTGVDASAVNRALGRGDSSEVFDFDITQNPNVTTDDLSSSTPSMALPGSLPASRSAEVSRALSRTSSAILSMPNAGIGSGIPRNLIDDELKTRAESGDRIAQAGLTSSPYELATDSRVPAVGIMTTPAATAANVLGIDRSNPREMAARESNMARMATADAGMITDASPRSNQVVLGGGVDDMGSGVPLGESYGRFTPGTDDMGSGVLPGGSYDRFTLGSDNMNLVNDARFGGPATLPTAAGTVRDLQRARNDASMLEDLRDTAPASIAAGPVLSGATGPASDIQNLINQAAANPRQGYTPNVVSSPELRGEKAAAGTPAENFYTDAYREQYPDVEGNIPGTTMAGIGNAVKSFPGVGMLLSGGPQDLPSATEQAAFKSGELLSMGGTMDPQTGAISDIPAGRGTLGMNRFGMVTYSGMPDPNYTGPYRELVNPPPEDMGGSDELKTASDPCPAGYQMVNGACQISGDEATDPAAPGSGFVINPNTGLPTLFQPTTQATQVGQVNPFVLQPYPRPPVGINPPRPMQGIQALSPTGAALGRAI